jgi:hypothetical protein
LRSAGAGYLTFQVALGSYGTLTLLLGGHIVVSTSGGRVPWMIAGIIGMMALPWIVVVVTAWRATCPHSRACGLAAIGGALAANAALIIPSPVSESVGLALFYASLDSARILVWMVIGWAAVFSLLAPSRWPVWRVLAVTLPMGYLLTLPYRLLLDLLMRDSDHWGIAAAFLGPLPIITTIVWYGIAFAWLRPKGGDTGQTQTAPDGVGPASA